MPFTLPVYDGPDFSNSRFKDRPVAVFLPAPADGVAPENFHATSNFPEYIQRARGEWTLLDESRMDCVVVRDGSRLHVREFRTLRKNEEVLAGRGENGEDGIYVHPSGFAEENGETDKFQFRTRATRETPFSRDYDFLYELLRYEREHGFVTWVLGPAVTFDRDSREAMASLIRNGYCHAVMAGNALGTHDLESSMFGTALGQDIYTKKNRPLGHYHHLDLLNRVRLSGSIERAVREMGLSGGILAACMEKNIPFVLAGSIRDDGPLPEVITDTGRSQDGMRVFARRSTTVIALATQLHAIAFGNMLPSYMVVNSVVRPVYFYIVDISEFAVDKLANRGSFQAAGISTNVQDFIVNCRRALV
ncbi:MAG: hypothetical protein EPN93_16505 [Spirochaetes bacterium]|nr:MAG: hypothetical protein EPN93_16505 [Spirochaetota bacterium]